MLQSIRWKGLGYHFVDFRFSTLEDTERDCHFKTNNKVDRSAIFIVLFKAFCRILTKPENSANNSLIINLIPVNLLSVTKTSGAIPGVPAIFLPRYRPILNYPPMPHYPWNSWRIFAAFRRVLFSLQP